MMGNVSDEYSSSNVHDDIQSQHLSEDRSYQSYQEPTFHLRSRTCNSTSTNDQIIADEKLVYYELQRVFRKSKAARREATDLSACAWLGLYEARQRFNPNLNISFESYARPRVRGAIYDGLAELMSPFGHYGARYIRRTLAQEYQGVNSTYQQLNVRLNFKEEVTNLSSTLSSTLSTQTSPPLNSLIDDLEENLTLDPLLITQNKEMRELMRELASLAFNQLKKTEKNLITAVYDLRDIGDNANLYAQRLHLHRSTVTRQQKIILIKLRKWIKHELIQRSMSLVPILNTTEYQKHDQVS